MATKIKAGPGIVVVQFGEVHRVAGMVPDSFLEMLNRDSPGCWVDYMGDDPDRWIAESLVSKWKGSIRILEDDGGTAPVKAYDDDQPRYPAGTPHGLGGQWMPLPDIWDGETMSMEEIGEYIYGQTEYSAEFYDVLNFLGAQENGIPAFNDIDALDMWLSDIEGDVSFWKDKQTPDTGFSEADLKSWLNATLEFDTAQEINAALTNGKFPAHDTMEEFQTLVHEAVEVKIAMGVWPWEPLAPPIAGLQVDFAPEDSYYGETSPMAKFYEDVNAGVYAGDGSAMLDAKLEAGKEEWGIYHTVGTTPAGYAMPSIAGGKIMPTNWDMLKDQWAHKQGTWTDDELAVTYLDGMIGITTKERVPALNAPDPDLSFSEWYKSGMDTHSWGDGNEDFDGNAIVAHKKGVTWDLLSADLTTESWDLLDMTTRTNVLDKIASDQGYSNILHMMTQQYVEGDLRGSDLVRENSAISFSYQRDADDYPFLKASLVSVDPDLMSRYNDYANFIHQWAVSSNDDNLQSLTIQQDAADLFGRETSMWQDQKFAEALKTREIFFETFGDDEERSVSPDYMYPMEYATVRNQFNNMAGEDLGEDSFFVRVDTEAKHYEFDARTQAQRMMRSIYGDTQQQMRDYNASTGNDTVTLYRGFSLSNQEALENRLKLGDTVTLEDNALESWTLKPTTANLFAETNGGRSLAFVVKADVPLEDIFSTAKTGFGCLNEWECVVLGAKNNAPRPVTVVKVKGAGMHSGDWHADEEQVAKWEAGFDTQPAANISGISLDDLANIEDDEND